MLVDPGWPQVADTADCRPKQLKLERAATATKISFDDTMDTGDRHRGRHTTHRAIFTFQNICLRSRPVSPNVVCPFVSRNVENRGIMSH